MQTGVLRCGKLILIAAIILGGFTFSQPAPVHAASSGMNHVPLQENLGCYKQGCTQQHTTCEKHCVRPAKEKQTMATLAFASHDIVAAHQTGSQTLLEEIEQGKWLVPALDRAPPTQKLLRSVIKRE